MKRVYVDATDRLERAESGNFAPGDWARLARLASRFRETTVQDELLSLTAWPSLSEPTEAVIRAVRDLVGRCQGRGVLTWSESAEPLQVAGLLIREWLVREPGRILVWAAPGRLVRWQRLVSGLGDRVVVLPHGATPPEELSEDPCTAWLVDRPPLDLLPPSARSSVRRLVLLSPRPWGAGQSLGWHAAWLDKQDVPLVRLEEELLVEGPAGSESETVAPDVRVVAVRPGEAEKALISELEGLTTWLHDTGRLDTGALASAWADLLTTAEVWPGALPLVAEPLLSLETEPLARARLLALLRVALEAWEAGPSIVPALQALVATSHRRVRLHVACRPAADGLRLRLPAGVDLIVDGDSFEAEGHDLWLHAEPVRHPVDMVDRHKGGQRHHHLVLEGGRSHRWLAALEVRGLLRASAGSWAEWTAGLSHIPDPVAIWRDPEGEASRLAVVRDQKAVG
ncbi:MAG: hypothetical protein VKO21_00390 [Candidatus Sericytochromatia bacterium]|nr:hypothetical protein [Candidatus Sericytochromatia bacterium]